MEPHALVANSSAAGISPSKALRFARIAALLPSVVGVAVVAAAAESGAWVGALQALGRVAFWGLLWMAAARLGAWLVGSRLTGLAHLAWDGAVGLGLAMTAWLVVGLLPGGFTSGALIAVAAVAAVAAAWRATRDPVARWAGVLGAPRVATVGLVALVSVIVGIGLAWNRVPSTFFDTLAYHYAQPELWLLDGRIAPQAWSLHSWFPPGMSVLYGVGLAFGGEPLAADANLLLGIVLVVLTFDLGRRLWSAGTGLLAAGLLATLPLTVYALAIPAADLGHGLFAAAALGALLLRRDDGNAAWTRRAGWLAAGAALTKYLGLLVPVGLGVAWLLLSAPGRQSTAARARELARFVVPVLLVLAPWLLANAVSVGNPVAPVASTVWPTTGLAPGGVESFRADARGGLPRPDLSRLAPRLFTGDEQESGLYPTPAWGYGPLVLLPALLLAFPRDRHVRRAMGLAALLFAVWLVTFRWERFLVAASCLLVLALAGGARHAWRRGGVFRGLPLAALPVVAIAAWIAGQEVARFTGGAVVALGHESRAEFLARSFPAAGVFDDLAGRLDPSTTRVLLLGEMRHFRIPYPRAAPTGFNTHPLVAALRDGGDDAAVSAELRRRGFTHLLVDPARVNRGAERYPSLAWLAEHPERLRRYVDALGPPLAARHGSALFEIPR